MKSTAKQEHNLNFKRNSYIPKMCVDPRPVGSTTSGGDAGHILPETSVESSSHEAFVVTRKQHL